MVNVPAQLSTTQGRQLLRPVTWQFQTGSPRILYLSWDDQQHNQLFSIGLNDSNPIALTQTEYGVFDFAVSPDAQTIAYTTLRGDDSSDIWLLSVSDGQTQTFLVGSKSEIEAILNAQIDDLLRIEEIPDRAENTLYYDDMHFDVPIMKVDTWVEEGWTEEMATDLVFKPSELEETFAVEEEAIHERRAQHQGRRRGRRNGRKRPEQSDFDIAEMNIVFRKRE